MQVDTNDPLFQEVVEEAKRATEGDARWHAAIDRAVRMLDGNPYVHLDGGNLLVMSDTSSEAYVVSDGSCQCRAFCEFRDPKCKHRTARRLLLRYSEECERRERARDSDGQTETAVLFDAPLMFPVRPFHFCLACGDRWACRGEWCCDGEREQVCGGCVIGQREAA